MNNLQKLHFIYSYLPLVMSLLALVFGCIFSIWFTTNNFAFFLLSLITICLFVAVLVVYLFGVKKLRFPKYTQDFLIYAGISVVVLIFQIGILYLSWVKFYPEIMCLVLCMSLVCWSMYIRKHKYIVQLYPLTPQASSFSTFLKNFKPLLLVFAVVGIGGVVFFGCLMLISFALDAFMQYAITHEMSIDTIEGWFAFFCAVILSGGVCFGFWGVKFGLTKSDRSIKKFLADIAKRPFFWGYGITRLVYFFRKYPKSKTNLGVLLLAFISFLRYLKPFFTVLAVISFRSDQGFSFSVFCCACLVISFIITTPGMHSYITGNFGSKALRLLGWNGPELTGLRLAAGAGIGFIGYKGLKTGVGIASDTFDGLRQINKDNVQTIVYINKTKNIIAANKVAGIPGHTSITKLTNSPKPPIGGGGFFGK